MEGVAADFEDSYRHEVFGEETDAGLEGWNDNYNSHVEIQQAMCSPVIEYQLANITIQINLDD